MQLDKQNILILDDDLETKNLLNKLFDSSLFTLSFVKQETQAISLLKSKKFILILSEIFINNKTTNNLIDFISNEYSKNQVPTLILINPYFSQEYQDNIKYKCQEISETIQKPFEKEELIKVLNKYNFFELNNLKFSNGTIENDTKQVVSGEDANKNDEIISIASTKENKQEDMIVKHLEVDNNDNIEKLKDINMRDQDGKTPLMIFAEKNHLENVKSLIEKGAQKELKCKRGMSAMHYATKANNVELITYLEESGLKVSARDSEQNTPLVYAIKYHSNKIVLTLITLGSRIDVKIKGQTYLMTAVKYKNAKAFKILMSVGSDPSVTDDRGQTVQMLAKRKKQTEILKLLKAFKILAEKKKNKDTGDDNKNNKKKKKIAA